MVPVSPTSRHTEDSFRASDEACEITPMVQVVPGSAEGDFISPEAQKLTGEILELSREHTDGAHSTAAEEKAADMNRTESGSVNPEDQGFVEREQAVDEDDQQPVNPDPTTGNTTESEVAEATPMLGDSVADAVPEEMNMTSRSSTIFVDMSSLTLQQEDSNV